MIQILTLLFEFSDTSHTFMESLFSSKADSRLPHSCVNIFNISAQTVPKNKFSWQGTKKSKEHFSGTSFCESREPRRVPGWFSEVTVEYLWICDSCSRLLILRYILKIVVLEELTFAFFGINDKNGTAMPLSQKILRIFNPFGGHFIISLKCSCERHPNENRKQPRCTQKLEKFGKFLNHSEKEIQLRA